MIHARKDYNSIQDSSGHIPEDEPVFLIRAKDKVGPLAVETWAELAMVAGADENIVRHAKEHAQRMREYQLKHGFKVPDMPEEGSNA